MDGSRVKEFLKGGALWLFGTPLGWAAYQNRQLDARDAVLQQQDAQDAAQNRAAWIRQGLIALGVVVIAVLIYKRIRR